jgi:hypothetical protein
MDRQAPKPLDSRVRGNDSIRALSPEELDRQYNARAAVAEHPQILARWAASSAAVRARLRCELDCRPGRNHFTVLDELADPESALFALARNLVAAP